MRRSALPGRRGALRRVVVASALISVGCSDQYADVGKIDLAASKNKAAEIGIEKGAAKPSEPLKRGTPRKPAEKPSRGVER